MQSKNSLNVNLALVLAMIKYTGLLDNVIENSFLFFVPIFLINMYLLTLYTTLKTTYFANVLILPEIMMLMQGFNLACEIKSLLIQKQVPF